MPYAPPWFVRLKQKHFSTSLVSRRWGRLFRHGTIEGEWEGMSGPPGSAA